jgi:hypothetical protein
MAAEKQIIFFLAPVPTTGIGDPVPVEVDTDGQTEFEGLLLDSVKFAMYQEKMWVTGVQFTYTDGTFTYNEPFATINPLIADEFLYLFG